MIPLLLLLGCGPDCGTVWLDADGDGHGDPGVNADGCAAEGAWAAAGDDCDDADPAVHPGAEEACDGRDGDCDGQIEAHAWVRPDADGDGWGGAEVASCAEGAESAEAAGDCDDADPAVNPTAADPCGDGVDADCDGEDACVERGNLEDADARFGDVGATSVALGAAGIALGEPYDGAWGHVTVFDASARGDLRPADARATVAGDEVGDQAGFEVAWIDGLLAVGAPSDDTAGENAGAVWFFPEDLTGSLAAADAVARLDGGGMLGYAGALLTLPGDATGDGAPDLAVVEVRDADVIVRVVPGPFAGTRSLADAPAIAAGEAVRVLDPIAPGDVDGDGVADLFVGGGEAGGRVAAWGFLGPLDADRTTAEADVAWASASRAWPEWSGPHARGAGAGDLDGDGVPEVAIAWGEGAWVLGDPLAGGDLDAGAVAVLEGFPTQTGTLAATMAAADLDGDARDDLVAGAAGEGAGRSGLVAVLFGPVAGTLAYDDADVLLWGERAGDGAGFAVSVGADVDGDGLRDVLIGSGADAAWLVTGLAAWAE